MYPPQQLHQPKRRKKRPIHGVKTVDVVRGKSGYGFTISGQHPCILSCIVNGSPADVVGLRPGDYLMSVNGVDVSKHSHDDVVCMVGTSTGTLTIQVAENYNSSDSSDDEYYHRTKAKYPHRGRNRAHKAYNEKMEKLLADINQRDRCPDGTSHDPNSRPIPNNADSKRYDLPKQKSSRPRVHTPVGAENNEIQAVGNSYIEAGASNLFKVPFQKSASSSNVPAAPTVPMHHRVEPKQAFIKSTSQGHVRPSSSSNSRSQPSHFKHKLGHMYDQFSPNSLQQIIHHSLHSYSAANEAFILNEDDYDDDDDNDVLVPTTGQEVKIVVGYIGSLEMPGDAHQPHIRIQSIRNAVRRLRVEQKIHTLVLMVVSPNVGVKLINMIGRQIAFYPVERLAFSGVCPDDKRFFGIVTLRSTSDDSDTDSDTKEELVGSSCHVFMVDQELTAHNIHALKAKSFGLECTFDPHTQRCMEFPRSTTPIILSITNLYKDRPGGSLENDMARSQVFANPNQPVVHVRTSSSSSNNSNSDSGLGLCRDDNQSDRGVAVVEMPPPPLPARERPPQLPQIKWSGNTMYLTDGPLKHSRNSSQSFDSVKLNVTLASSRDTTATSNPDMSTSSEEFSRAADRLNIRAMPNVTPNSARRLSGDGLDNQHTAESLRLGMQKLLQARQKHAGLDHTSSDTESRSSKSDTRASTSDLRERPVSAPFKYLSDESLTTNKPSKNRVNHIKHDSDSSLADKLSPRAFLSSAFTPLGSVGSAFKKTRSRAKLKEMRSPSAPPIPNYHGDDEDSGEEEVNDIIKRLQRDKGLGQNVMDADIPVLPNNFTQINKRDQERRGAPAVPGTPELGAKPSTPRNSTEKWTKGQPGSLRKARRNPLSLSHESLVVLDHDPLQQKLASASSVNSIANHVAHSIEQEEVGRVAAWAVSFEKLLKDTVGITVFTDFLKKEFSEENVEFWKACEDFKIIIDSNYRKSKAKEIYDKHVSVRASDCVNIDSVARKAVEEQLENPTPKTFDIAQKQIFQLMKQDSYARFLKSDLYKSYMMDEMEGKPIMAADSTPLDKQKILDKAEKEGKKKGKGKENEEKSEKRRRSLLPWRQKSKKQSKSESDIKSTKETKDINANTTPSVSSATIETSSKKEPVVEVPETIEEEEPEQPKFCRVIMPDGSTTVVGTRQGQTINYILGKLCEKRSLSIASVDVFLLGSEKPLNLNDDISTLGSKEITIERRVLFRMDLPNKKSIGVKAKPNRLIKDVFKPILNKYGYRMDAIDVHLSGQADNLCLDNLVSTIDSQRVIVLNQAPDLPAKRNGLLGRYKPSTRPPLPNKFTSKFGYRGNTNTINNNNNNNNLEKTDAHSLAVITNEIFGNLMLDKSDQYLAHNFDELGILDPDSGPKVLIAEVQRPSLDLCEQGTDRQEVEAALTKDPVKMGKSRQKVTFDLKKNTFRNQIDDNDSSAQSECFRSTRNHSLDGEHVLATRDRDLPDFLQGTMDSVLPAGRESAPASLSSGDDFTTHKQSRDFMAEINNYIESINENFAAYTRESTPSKSDAKKTSDKPIPMQHNNKSFSEDGIVPSNDEAHELFQGSNTVNNADFNDPHLTEKSLTDIGFSYSHNKYLSKSRNFVNQRKPNATFSSTNSVPNQEPLVVSAEMFSPNQTLRNGLLNQSEALESTLLNSSRSSPSLSPYSSDSSLDKENVGGYVPKTSVHRTSRHTLIHSPLHSPLMGTDGDSFLSTVDTDSKIARHSTPKTSKGVKYSLAGRTPKVLNSTAETQSMGISHTDEVTFV